MVLALGWVFQVGRKTTTGLVRGAGHLAQKHYASYSRFFNTTSWACSSFWRWVFDTVQDVVDESRLIMAVDDTCVSKSGRAISASGWFVDSSGSSYQSTTYVWGQCWVVLSVVVSNPLGFEKTWSFPVGLRLFVPKDQCLEGTYQSKLEIAHKMVQQRSRWAERPLLVLADRLYAGGPFMAGFDEDVDVIVRMKRNAKLFELPGPSDGVGRPRKKGQRFPSPEEWVNEADGWETVEATLYGTKKEIQIQSRMALWYDVTGTNVGRIVLMKESESDRWAVFYSTDPQLEPGQIPELYSRRWALEITIRDAKQYGGFKDAQCRTDDAVRRQGTFNLGLMSLVQCWFCQQDKDVRERLNRDDWEDAQAPPSFQIMLQTLRWELRTQQFSQEWGQTPCSGKKIEEFFDEIARAA